MSIKFESLDSLLLGNNFFFESILTVYVGLEEESQFRDIPSMDYRSGAKTNKQIEVFLQILFQFPNKEFPITDCRGIWTKTGK